MRGYLAITLFLFALAGCAMESAPASESPSIHVTVDNPSHKDFYDKAPLWIGIGGLVGILVALASLGYLAQQVKEAKEQRHLSERTAKQQLRAYLCVDEACLKKWVEVKGVTKLQGQLHVKNVGQTPAYNVRSWTHGSIRPYPENNPVEPPPAGMPTSTEIVPAQGKRIIVAKVLDVSASALQTLETGANAYVIQGEIRYQDIFKDWHVLKIRYFHGGAAGTATTQDANGMTMGYLIPDEWGNSDEDVEGEA